jgi:hypothetical protein
MEINKQNYRKFDGFTSVTDLFRVFVMVKIYLGNSGVTQ